MHSGLLLLLSIKLKPIAVVLACQRPVANRVSSSFALAMSQYPGSDDLDLDSVQSMSSHAASQSYQPIIEREPDHHIGDRLFLPSWDRAQPLDDYVSSSNDMDSLVARLNSLPAVSDDHMPRATIHSQSDSSSLAVLSLSLNSCGGTEASSQVPSLSTGNDGSSIPLSNSIPAEARDYHSYPEQFGPEYEHMPTVAFVIPEILFGCLFGRLGCVKTFGSEKRWAEHSKTHFDQSGPPRTIKCPFQCASEWSHASESGAVTWRHLRAHVADEHENGGICDIQNDSALAQYLWRQRIIDDAQLQYLQSNGRSDIGNVSVSSQRPRDRRENRTGYRQVSALATLRLISTIAAS